MDKKLEARGIFTNKLLHPLGGAPPLEARRCYLRASKDRVLTWFPPLFLDILDGFDFNLHLCLCVIWIIDVEGGWNPSRGVL